MPDVLHVVPSPRTGLFDTYQPLAGAFDEMVSQDGHPRSHTQRVHGQLCQLSSPEFARYQSLAELSLFNQGVTFSVYSDKPRHREDLPALPRAARHRARGVGRASSAGSCSASSR